MFYRLCCCCLDGGSSVTAASNLVKSNKNGIPASNADKQYYTVRRISRARSNDEVDDRGLEKGAVTLQTNGAAWSNRSSSVPPEYFTDEADSRYGNSPRGSPVIKKKKWKKMLPKTKNESTNIKKEESLHSLANVSTLILPRITVAESNNSSSSSQVNLDLDGSAAKGSTSAISLNRPLGAKHLSAEDVVASPWLKSQSMLNVNCVGNGNEDKVSERVGIAKKNGLDTPFKSATHLSKSMEAVNRAWKSMEDVPRENNFVDLPMGSVHFLASYSVPDKKLFIHVQKIEGLAPKGGDRHKYNCVLKLAILPHEKHLKNGRVIPGYSSLSIDEKFTFNVKDVKSKVLRISVYPAAYQGKYDAVGHALFYIEDALSKSDDLRVLKLYKQSLPDAQPSNLQLSMKYNKQTEMLNLIINQADHLRTYSRKCKTYIKLQQYQAGKKVREMYSQSAILNEEVRFNYKTDLKIESNVADNTYIVVCVKVKGFWKKDTPVGRLILGPYFYAEYGQMLTPWGKVFLFGDLVSHTFRLSL